MSNKPKPISQPESDKYWNGLKNKEIWIQKCKTTNNYQFYPRAHCINCTKNDIEWVKVNGEATLFSFAIVFLAPIPEFAEDVPYINALIKLKEGPIIPTNLVNINPDPEKIKIGMKLKPVFEKIDETLTLLKFEPSKQTAN